MKFNMIGTLILLIAAGLATPLMSASGEKGGAQDPDDDLQIGVLYKCEDNSQTFKVLSCDENKTLQCRVQYLPSRTIANEPKAALKAFIGNYGCKPADPSTPKAKPKPAPQEPEEPDSEPEAKPAPKKKPESKPTPKPTAEPEPEPEADKDDAASAQPAPAPAGPQFSIGDCVQVDGGNGVINRADSDNFYVNVNGTSKRVPFSSASKMKKASGCGN